MIRGCAGPPSQRFVSVPVFQSARFMVPLNGLSNVHYCVRIDLMAVIPATSSRRKNTVNPPQELRSNHKEPSLEPSEEPSKGACASRAALCELKRPDWLPEDAWRDWVSYRKTHKSRFTEKAAELSLCELAKLRERGFEPRAVIE